MTSDARTLARPPRSLESWWKTALPWDEYLAREVVENRPLWEGVYRRARIPEWAHAELERLGRSWKLLAISEDWCGDASNLLPVFARLADTSPRVELRIVKRDENPKLMDRYLTNGSRSIPIVVVLNEKCRPVGRWGPRPVELQDLVIRQKRAGERPASEIYRETRRWYAMDRGETTLREVLAVMARAE
jgi:hypothetical protein